MRKPVPFQFMIQLCLIVILNTDKYCGGFTTLPNGQLQSAKEQFNLFGVVFGILLKSQICSSSH